MTVKIRIGFTVTASSKSIVPSQQTKSITLRTFATRIRMRFARKLRHLVEFCFPKRAKARKERKEQLRPSQLRAPCWRISESNTVSVLVLNVLVVKTKSWRKTSASRESFTTLKLAWSLAVNLSGIIWTALHPSEVTTATTWVVSSFQDSKACHLKTRKLSRKPFSEFSELIFGAISHFLNF